MATATKDKTKDRAKGPGRAARAAGAKDPNAKDPAQPRRADEARRAADLLRQVSDATRLRVLMILGEGETNVGDLCKELGGASQPAVSHHLSLLRHGGLITPIRCGKNNVYHLTDKGRGLIGAVRSLVGG